MTQYPDLSEAQEAELATLIDQLHDTQERIRSLAGDGVDVVLHSSGAPYLLRRAQDELRETEALHRRFADERAAILDALPAHIALLDTEGRIVAVNRAWQRFAADNALPSRDGGLGVSYLEVCTCATGPSSDEATAVADGIREVLNGETDTYSIEYPCHSPRELRWFLLTVTPVGESGAGAVVMHIDVTQRKHDELVGLGEIEVLDLISGGASLAAVLERVTRLIDSLCLQGLTGILVSDAARTTLHHGASASLPSEFLDTMDGLPMGPQAASCGTAAWRRERVIVPDIATDPLWDGRREAARNHGLHSCWSTPVTGGDGSVRACIGVYYRQPVTPTSRELALVDRMARLVDLAIERIGQDEALRLSEQRFQAVAEATTDVIWDWDLETDTVRRSESFARSFGWDASENNAGPNAWINHVHPEDRDRVVGGLCAAIERKKPRWRDEYRLIREDGTVAHIEDSASLLLDRNGKPSRFVGGMSDVTERIHARERIGELQRRLETLVEHAKVGILVHRNFVPIHANTELARLLGYDSADEILALEDCRVLFAEDELARIEEYNRARLDGEDAADFYRVRGQRRDGSVITMENRAFALRWGEQQAVCAMLTDISAQLQNEERLRRAQRLEAVGQLTGGIAHDFNNLLTVILGNAEFMADTLPDESLRELAEMIRASAERGAALTSHLLAFSRRQPLIPGPANICKLIQGLNEILSQTLGDRIDVSTKCESEDLHALVDVPQLESAILNICLNARDAMPEGGSIAIEASSVQLDASEIDVKDEVVPGHFVLITVSDTGTGMPGDVAAKAFEPFFTTKDVGEGSGLGLSMVYGFAKQSAGHVTLHSEIGVGTTVGLYLPYLPSNSAPAIPVETSEAHPASGTEKILIVEDHSLVRTQVASQLEVLGYQVLTAPDAREALAILEQTPDIDLLFTDIIMPGDMNGLQLAEIARRHRPGLPVLLTSGNMEEAPAETDDFDPEMQRLQKPYKRRALARAIRQALEDRRDC